ncbi:hypothetical protein FOA52_013852 [Chlamydomonas sp. UWO 241]|nr:hypothetical protein FOA52_013852 [Chlamydomonas sp. UWO 241]
MGVPGFATAFRDEYRGAYVPRRSVKFDHVMVDVNSVLHIALREASTWEQFHKMLHSRLDTILSTANPRKSVMLAVDGPGPLAKLLTQRARRAKRDKPASGDATKKAAPSWNTKQQERRGGGGGARARAPAPRGSSSSSGGDSGSATEERGDGSRASTTPEEGSDEAGSSSVSGGEEGEEGGQELSGNMLTPGTMFMLDVSLSLRAWAANKLAQVRWRHLAIEVSDAGVPGEGEVKILGRLARPWQEGGEHDTYAIFGEDSDLLLLALLSRAPQLYVMRKVYEPDLFSVAALHKLWTSSLLPTGREVLGQSDAEVLLGLKCDMVLLTIMSKGNDYLPALAKADKLRGRSLWHSHCAAWRAWVPGPGNNDGPGIVRVRRAVPELRARALAALLVGCGAENLLPASNADESAEGAGKARPSAEDYVHGMVWVAHMYLQGECPDYRYSYDAGAPAPAQVLSLMEGLDNGTLCMDSYDNTPPPPPLVPLGCALAMLPARCAPLLPRPARAIMMGPSSPELQPMFAVCGECTSRKGEISRTGSASAAAKARLAAAQAALDVLAAGGAGAGSSEEGAPEEGTVAEVAPSAEALRSEIEAATAAVARTRTASRAANAAMQAHTKDVHPYQPFPVQALTDAVSQLPASDFSPAERALTQLGYSSVLTADRRRAPAPSPTFSPSGASGAAAAALPTRTLVRWLSQYPAVLPQLAVFSDVLTRWSGPTQYTVLQPTKPEERLASLQAERPTSLQAEARAANTMRRHARGSTDNGGGGGHRRTRTDIATGASSLSSATSIDPFFGPRPDSQHGLVKDSDRAYSSLPLSFVAPAGAAADAAAAPEPRACLQLEVRLAAATAMSKAAREYTAAARESARKYAPPSSAAPGETQRMSSRSTRQMQLLTSGSLEELLPNVYQAHLHLARVSRAPSSCGDLSWNTGTSERASVATAHAGAASPALCTAAAVIALRGCSEGCMQHPQPPSQAAPELVAHLYSRASLSKSSISQGMRRVTSVSEMSEGAEVSCGSHAVQRADASRSHALPRDEDTPPARPARVCEPESLRQRAVAWLLCQARL